MQQKLIKVIAMLLTTTILYANSAAVVSYAAIKEHQLQMKM